MLTSAAACLLRAGLVRRERLAWALLGVGLLLYTGGEIYYSAVLSGQASVPIPSPADAGYLAFYPLAYAGLIVLLRTRIGAFPVGALARRRDRRLSRRRARRGARARADRRRQHQRRHPRRRDQPRLPDRRPDPADARLHRHRVHRLAAGAQLADASAPGCRPRRLRRRLPAAGGPGDLRRRRRFSTSPGRSASLLLARAAWVEPGSVEPVRPRAARVIAIARRRRLHRDRILGAEQFASLPAARRQSLAGDPGRGGRAAGALLRESQHAVRLERQRVADRPADRTAQPPQR